MQNQSEPKIAIPMFHGKVLEISDVLIYFEKKKGGQAQKYFKEAFKSAKKQNLLLEMAHAKRKISLINPWPTYRGLVVDVNQFKKYKSLP